MTTPAYRWFTGCVLLFRLTNETTWIFNPRGTGWIQTDTHPHFVETDSMVGEITESTARELFPEAFPELKQESKQ